MNRMRVLLLVVIIGAVVIGCEMLLLTKTQNQLSTHLRTHPQHTEPCVQMTKLSRHLTEGWVCAGFHEVEVVIDADITDLGVEITIDPNGDWGRVR